MKAGKTKQRIKTTIPAGSLAQVSGLVKLGELFSGNAQVFDALEHIGGVGVGTKASGMTMPAVFKEAALEITCW
jgi:hypothetical protein